MDGASGPVLAPPLSAETHQGLLNSLQPPHPELPGLPAGFPSFLNERLAWTGAEFQRESDYVLQLQKDDLEDIRSALASFKAKELDGDLVSRFNFPLSTLGPKLEGVKYEIHSGKGFGVVRGLNAREFSVEDMTIIWLGIQAYIADQQGCQDHKGNMLVHIVADNSSQLKLGHHRHSTSAISFHNEEAGDIVSWLTRSTAAAGGKCIIASTYAIYNILAAHRPDIIRTLAKGDWAFGIPRFHCRPVAYFHDSKFIVNFGRTPLLGSAIHPRPEHYPKVSDRQLEALNAIEAIAQAAQLEIKTQAGDMHFINNLAILHRREGFVNGAASHEKRHLVRMRLRDSQAGWSIPQELKRDWHDAFERGTGRTWHLEPMPGDAFPLRKYTN